MLQQISNTFTMSTCSTDTIIAYKTKTLSDKNIKHPTTLDNSFASKMNKFIIPKWQQN